MSQWAACLTSWSHLHDSFLMAILPGHYKVKQLIIFMIVGCLLAPEFFPSWGTLSFMQACLILLPMHVRMLPVH